MDTSGQAKKGDKKIPTRVWNRLVRNMDDAEARRFSTTGGGGSQTSHTLLWIKNTTGSDVRLGDVLVVTGMAASSTPTAYRTDDAVTSRFCYGAVALAYTPSEDNQTGFVVVAEQIKAGEVGSAVAAGVAAVSLNVTDDSHKYAFVKNGQLSLATATSGAAEIMWKQSGTGQKWALVRIGTQQQAIKRGTFTAPWSKGSTKTVDEVLGSVRYTNVKNYFASVTGSGTKACAIAYVAGEWILIAAECG